MKKFKKGNIIVYHDYLGIITEVYRSNAGYRVKLFFNNGGTIGLQVYKYQLRHAKPMEKVLYG